MSTAGVIALPVEGPRDDPVELPQLRQVPDLLRDADALQAEVDGSLDVGALEPHPRRRELEAHAQSRGLVGEELRDLAEDLEPLPGSFARAASASRKTSSMRRSEGSDAVACASRRAPRRPALLESDPDPRLLLEDVDEQIRVARIGDQPSEALEHVAGLLESKGAHESARSHEAVRHRRAGIEPAPQVIVDLVRLLVGLEPPAQLLAEPLVKELPGVRSMVAAASIV